MLAKYFNYFFESRRQFIIYFSIGVSGTILDIFSLWILKEFFGLIPVVAVIINQLLVLFYIFLFNKKFSFKANGDLHKQIFRFFVLAGANYLFAILWMWWWNHYLHYNYLLVRICNIALAITWNFVLYKEWVYKITKEQNDLN